MIAERFYIFTLLIDGIHKCIHRIKFDFAPHFGVKSVHMFWIYELRDHPDGLTSAELAERTGLRIDLIDERRTTVEAHNILGDNGVYRQKRKDTVDAVAASLILEIYMAKFKREAAEK